tara:strand:- start:743 stop:880 length:138 start_codon:yes stop_codon:yes gene_type:complete
MVLQQKQSSRYAIFNVILMKKEVIGKELKMNYKFSQSSFPRGALK